MYAFITATTLYRKLLCNLVLFEFSTALHLSKIYFYLLMLRSQSELVGLIDSVIGNWEKKHGREYIFFCKQKLS